MDISNFICIGIQESLSTKLQINERSHRYKILRKIEKMRKKIVDTYIFDNQYLKWKYIDYNKRIFEKIRKLDNIENEYFIKSFVHKIKEYKNKNSGRSRSLFYITYDKKYIIKTVYNTEYKFLRSILKKYYYYLRNNENTYLIKFYALGQLKNTFLDIRFVIMNNVFYNHNIQRIYDLKGTTENRFVSSNNLVYKDLNFKIDNQYLNISKYIYDQYWDNVVKDTKFLESINIMDYSLIFGLIDKNEEEKKSSDFNNKNIIIGNNNDNYIIGIIDILQNWNLKKKITSHFKKCIYSCYKIDIDTEPPNIYRKRFIFYITSTIIK